MYKQCTKCKKTKIISEFYYVPRYSDALSSYCKDCMSKYNRKYYKNKKAKKLFTTLVEVIPPSIERDLFLWKLAIAGAIGLLFIGIAYSIIFILG